jgi:hypothetical protein
VSNVKTCKGRECKFEVVLNHFQEETFWSDGFLVHPYEDTLAKLSLEVPEMLAR